MNVTSKPSIPERVFEAAKEAVPEPVRKVAWAVALPPYLALALGGAGAAFGGTIGMFGGPVGLLAGGFSGAVMGGTLGATLGAQLALAALRD